MTKARKAASAPVSTHKEQEESTSSIDSTRGLRSEGTEPELASLSSSSSRLSWTQHESIRYNLRSRSKNIIPKIDMSTPVPEANFLNTRPIAGAFSRLDPNNTEPSTLRLCLAERKKANYQKTYCTKPTVSKSWMTHHDTTTAEQQVNRAFERKCTNFDGTFTDTLERGSFSIENPGSFNNQSAGSSDSTNTIQTAFRRSLSPCSLPSELDAGDSTEHGSGTIAHAVTAINTTMYALPNSPNFIFATAEIDGFSVEVTESSAERRNNLE